MLETLRPAERRPEPSSVSVTNNRTQSAVWQPLRRIVRWLALRPGWMYSLPFLLLLVGGAAWHIPTLHVDNYLQFAASRWAYSDVVAFYYSPIAAAHQLPYVQAPLEYPVLTGAMLWLTGFAPSIEWYLVANAVLLCGCLVGCYALLARMRPLPRLALFALAPGLAIYSVLNWDAPALLALVVAISLVRSRRFGWAGVALALGTSAKLFPAFAFLAILAYCLRCGDVPMPVDASEGDDAPGLSARQSLRITPAAVRFVAAFIGVTLALNLPLA